MRPINLKKLNYKDEVVRRNRRSFILKMTAVSAGIIFVVAGLIYLLFFSSLFDVREVGFNGLDTVNSDEFHERIEDKLNQKILNYLPRRNNIFFLNTGDMEVEFASSYPVFKTVSVQRKLLHGLMLNFSERKPVGIWCFVDSCSYFDKDKALWGQPAKSSGFIFLTVEDQREISDKKIDDEFFKPVMMVAKSMPGNIRNIVIPLNSFNEFRVYTTEYYFIFSTDSDIQSQLDILKIFMDEKSKDPDFHPQYIDLRIDGRVYYK